MGKYGERVGLGLLVAAAVMVPWLYLLSGSLPDTTRVSGWSTAWVGLDVMEGLALLATGLLLLRRDPRVSPVAAVTAALLLVDAWFDVTTSSSGRALLIAIAMALLVELPLCALCALIARGTLGSSAVAAPSSSSVGARPRRARREPDRLPPNRRRQTRRSPRPSSSPAGTRRDGVSPRDVTPARAS